MDLRWFFPILRSSVALRLCWFCICFLSFWQGCDCSCLDFAEQDTPERSFYPVSLPDVRDPICFHSDSIEEKLDHFFSLYFSSSSAGCYKTFWRLNVFMIQVPEFNYSVQFARKKLCLTPLISGMAQRCSSTLRVLSFMRGNLKAEDVNLISSSFPHLEQLYLCSAMEESQKEQFAALCSHLPEIQKVAVCSEMGDFGFNPLETMLDSFAKCSPKQLTHMQYCCDDTDARQLWPVFLGVCGRHLQSLRVRADTPEIASLIPQMCPNLTTLNFVTDMLPLRDCVAQAFPLLSCSSSSSSSFSACTASFASTLRSLKLEVADAEPDRALDPTVLRTIASLPALEILRMFSFKLSDANMELLCAMKAWPLLFSLQAGLGVSAASLRSFLLLHPQVCFVS